MSCRSNCAVVFSFVGFALLLAALSSEFWVEGLYHMGLWKFCQNGFRCVLLDMDVPGYIHATRAFMLTAAVAGAVSFFGLCCLCCSSHSGSNSLVKTSAIASFIAGLCALIAMATFTGVYSEHYQRHTWYDWSLGVGWGSVPLYLLAGVLASKVQTVAVI